MKKDNIFWISFADLMVSLFFIMLVLFVVTIGYLKIQIEATEKQLEKIQELQTSVQQLPDDYFDYQPKYKRFKLKRQIQFGTGISKIPFQYHQYLKEVGQSISTLIIRLNNEEKYKGLDIKYLVVIEGMASRDNYPLNFPLSYERALAVYKLWQESGIAFDPKYCEIQISGSGPEGIREYPYLQEKKNQQILIHIIPKMGKIVDNDL